ncbi:type IV pilus modification protein PilV [Dyella sp. C9]|uniref:type IV pilus modification protein PilV n=1 Tax=Dyella sp. C9 TaxID=2202154 RepID=UPI001E3B5400|nr:type IV pilus modification protein PilV [Dyella sp. C9]
MSFGKVHTDPRTKASAASVGSDAMARRKRNAVAQRPRRARRERQRGVGMIEVLVAVLILAIAFLGVAALQATALAANNSAMARSMATIASYSILDAMRVDQASATTSAYNQTVKATACSTDTSTLANSQLGQWCTLLGNTLGVADTTTGTVACLSNGDCTVTITFTEVRKGANGDTAQSVTTRAML